MYSGITTLNIALFKTINKTFIPIVVNNIIIEKAVLFLFKHNTNIKATKNIIVNNSLENYSNYQEVIEYPNSHKYYCK